MMKRPAIWIVIAASAAIAIGTVWVLRPSCNRWDVAIGQPGFDDPVRVLAIFDHGEGPKLYAGGFFLEADDRSAARIARFNGRGWSSLGAAINGPVRAMAVFDDGDGPALYVAGQFTQIRGRRVNHIARFDGESWSALGPGLDDWVAALAVYDDGGGPALYAAGQFKHAAEIPVNHIARWTGESWEPLGGGTDAPVHALAVYDDRQGAHPELVIGGDFENAGSKPAMHIARWNGEQWSDVGGGTNHYVTALATGLSGQSQHLYAGGRFGMAGEVSASHIAAWDGQTWRALGNGVDREVAAIAVVEKSSGRSARMYAAGRFRRAGEDEASRIARWDGRTWSPLDRGVNDRCAALLATRESPDGRHEDDRYTLYVAGSFTRAGRRQSMYIAAWEGCFSGRK